MKITNKDVIQSYLMTAARYDFNVEEKRIMYRLVEFCQAQLEGKKLNGNFHINKTLFGDYVVKMPISAFLAKEDDKNHARVKEALRRLRNKTIEYEDDKVWELIGIIEKPKFDKRGYTEFEIQPKIYDAILDFSKGFRKFELKTAMGFDSVYAMRFYELFSGKKEPISYGIDKLKIMFKLENKYKLTTDFIRKVIEPAKKELDNKSPYSFTYKKETLGRKVIALKFFPYEISENKDSDLERKQLQKQMSIKWDLDKIVIDYLKQNYYFDNDEIKNNIETFKLADKEMDLLNFLSKKRRSASTKKNPKGWLINGIKKEIIKG